MLDGALKSLAGQSVIPYEILLGDDNPPDAIDEIHATQLVVEKFPTLPIRYIKNPINLGCGRNVQSLAAQVTGDIIFFLAQDDVLAADALKLTLKAFDLDPDVGVVTRPYFWFMDSIDLPVRMVPPYDSDRDVVLSLSDGKNEFLSVFSSVGQLSGLAYRREWLTVPFHEEIFPTHIYPFAGIWREHKCVFLKDYTVAIGIRDSQTRSVSSIYDLSPTESWLKMYRTVFSGPKYAEALRWGEEHITTNYMGLVQLKNYAKAGVLNKEIRILIRERPKNLLSASFWFFVIGTLITPRPVLRRLVDWYKTHVYSKTLLHVRFRPAFPIE